MNNHPYRTLEHRKLWLVIGWLLVAVVIVLSLMPKPPQLFTFNYADKLNHIVAYAVLMGWFVQIYRLPGIHVRFALGFIMMGVAIEFLQGLDVYRQFDIVDMLANTVGVSLAWVFARTGFSQLLVRFEQMLLTLRH